MGNFDLSALALKAVCPTNDILYDDKGLPSVMVYIPKFKISDVITGGSDSIHPAFIVNGTEVDGIYISKYQNVVNNGRAYSLPCEDPKSTIDFNTALSVCSSKGPGWHCITRAEWAAIALWCGKNNHVPKGNNSHGKDSLESIYKAIPVTYGSDGKVYKVATGSGPLTWSHDNTLGGIWDLKGNVWEWTGGIRTVYGELQVLANNNAADSRNSQDSASTQWKAIHMYTGAYITPNGSGTTSNSVKMDWINNRLHYTDSLVNQENTSRICNFSDIECSTGMSSVAKDVLKALGLLLSAELDYYSGTSQIWFNNGSAERMIFSGGAYNHDAVGIFTFSGTQARNYSHERTGFRSAFVKLPSE